MILDVKMICCGGNTAKNKTKLLIVLNDRGGQKVLSFYHTLSQYVRCFADCLTIETKATLRFIMPAKDNVKNMQEQCFR